MVYMYRDCSIWRGVPDLGSRVQKVLTRAGVVLLYVAKFARYELYTTEIQHTDKEDPNLKTLQPDTLSTIGELKCSKTRDKSVCTAGYTVACYISKLQKNSSEPLTKLLDY